MRWTRPHEGQTRDVEGFLLIPRKMRVERHSEVKEWRWLERAKWRERYYEFPRSMFIDSGAWYGQWWLS